jgi:ligand-binding SRPBCC domain-containing protein
VLTHTRLWRAAAIGQSDAFFRIATRLAQLSLDALLKWAARHEETAAIAK